MKKIFFLCLIVIFPATTFSQNISSSVANKYSSSVIVRVFDILVKVKLSDQKQVYLAEKFDNEDKEIAALIVNGGSMAEINAAKDKYKRLIEKVFTVEELALYTNKKSTDQLLHLNSKFLSAIQNKEALKLTKSQYDSLLANGLLMEKLKANFKSPDPRAKFDSQAFENDKIPKIISDEQYDFLFKIKYKDKSIEQAKSDWKELKQRGLAKDLDSTIVINEMAKYSINRAAAVERYKNDGKMKAEAVSKIDENIPTALSFLKQARKYKNPIDTVGGVAVKSDLSY